MHINNNLCLDQILVTKNMSKKPIYEAVQKKYIRMDVE